MEEDVPRVECAAELRCRVDELKLTLDHQPGRTHLSRQCVGPSLLTLGGLRLHSGLLERLPAL